MRIISKKILKTGWEKHTNCQNALSAWYTHMDSASLGNFQALKQQFASVKSINSNHVVFSLLGKSYKLIAKIDYGRQLIFIVWFGTDKDYEKINMETLAYAGY